jgi:predicted dehydrogenase
MKTRRRSGRRFPTRRQFIRSAGAVAAAGTGLAGGFPAIVPATVFGQNAPGNRITVGAIGTGRISRGHDMPGIWKYGHAQIVAVCDLDSRRVQEAKTLVDGYYTKRAGKPYEGVTPYSDFRELLANRDIDAVVISTPDHWHALPAILAVEAGKHVYLQKPASLTIAEGRALSNAVHRSGRVLQVGSQQRSSPQWRYAAELVRNGRIGQLRTVQVGLPVDPPGAVEPPQPIPAGLTYEMWLGSTPYVDYTENRVHPQKGYGRPGWLRCEQFGAGMITGWGAHHLDCAHWAMDTEHTGPIEIRGTAEFPASGLWDVHGSFRTEARYANGITMIVSGDFPNGIRFEGTGGWIFVSRGNEAATRSDPRLRLTDPQALGASNPALLESIIGENEIHLEVSADHHGNWLDAIRFRRPPIAPVEIAHRSCTACLLHHAAMKLPRTLHWDPIRERFRNDDEANGLLSRPQRAPWTLPA